MKILIVIALFCSSCQKIKNWECRCEYGDPTESGTYSENINWRTEKGAKKRCKNIGMALAGDLGTSSCKLIER